MFKHLETTCRLTCDAISSMWRDLNPFGAPGNTFFGPKMAQKWGKMRENGNLTYNGKLKVDKMACIWF